MSFSNMTPERRKEIARMGQAALKASGKRRTFTPEEAKKAATLAAEARKRNKVAREQGAAVVG